MATKIERTETVGTDVKLWWFGRYERIRRTRVHGVNKWAVDRRCSRTRRIRRNQNGRWPTKILMFGG